MDTPVGAMASVTTRCQRNVFVLIGFVTTTIYSVAAGPDLNFDLRNIRAYNAWMIVRGRLSDDPISNLLTQYLPFHDIVNVILIGTGYWWLPVLFWGAIHASTIFVANRLLRLVAPNVSDSMRQLTAIASLATPLIMMEIGTAFGDLTAAPVLGLMFIACLERRDSWNWCSAGVLLALAAIIKPTVVLGVPPLLVAVAIIAYSGVQVATFLSGFAGAYFPLGLAWALYWSHEANQRYLSMPGLPITGIRFVVLATASLATLVFVLLPPSRRIFERLDVQLSRRRAIWLLRLGLVGATLYQGKNWHNEFLAAGAGTDGSPGATDWMVKNTSDFARRLIHTGGLKDGYKLLDLEMPYRDFRVLLAVAVVIGALVACAIHLLKDTYESFRSGFGLTIGVVGSILFMIWIVGYARYFIQYLPFVPVAGLAVISGMTSMSPRPTARRARKFGAGLVAFVSCLAVLPIAGGSPHVRKFAQTESSGDLLSPHEAEMLNALIAPHSTVHIAGILVSSAAVYLNRSDVTWTYAIPSKEEIQQQNRQVVYSPQWQKGMIGLRESGIKTENCSVLRFRYVVYGICDLKL